MNPKDDKRLFLLDAYALIFRGYYAFIKNPRINSKGLNTSAIFGFMNSLLDVINREKPTHLAVVFDVGRKTIRHEYFPEYKATRDETPEPIRLAVPYIQDILRAMHIPIMYAEGYEADDVIGTLSRKAEDAGYQTFMMTPDKDFAQLVTENVKIYRPASRGGGFEILGIKEVQDKFGVNEPIQVIDILGMTGDTVDNIPGIPGVGPKTAEKFIKEFGSLENLLANAKDIKGKVGENVREFSEQALLSKKLATILIDAPIEFIEEEYTIDRPDFDRIKEIFSELEFRRILENLYRIYGLEDELAANQPQIGNGEQISMFGDSEAPSAPVGQDQIRNIQTVSHLYQTVDSAMGRKLLIQNLKQQKEISFDTETTGLNALEAELVGISFSFEPHSGYYVSIPEDFEEAKSIIGEFREILESPDILKIAHNIKYDTKVLFKYGIEISEPVYDTMIAHYLINPDMRHNMDNLSETYLGYAPVPIESLIGKKGKNQLSFRQVEIRNQTEYAVEDTDVTLQLQKEFNPKIDQIGARKLMENIEFPLAITLAHMEKTGITLDVNALKEMSETLAGEISKLETLISNDAGHSFNLNSPKQLGDVLFEELKILSNPKKTKTGQYATSEDILVKLKDKHPIIEHILEYRQVQKLKSTYVDALPNEVSKKDGRIHTVFAQTVAATGRLASNNPNLQNIPIRTERGQEVRKAFVAKDDDHVLIAADYSQIELRLIAALSGDPAMMESFKKGEDIHASTAAKVFGVPLNEVTRTQRSQAKTVNFGIIYGVSAFGLSEQTGLSRNEAKQLIDAYFETYPTLQKYMQSQIELARRQGFVETILGRRRYLPDIHSANHVVKGQAERIAVNAPVQGSAADVIKVAMVEIHQMLQKEDFRTKMLLQVHDELVFESPKDELERILPLIKHKMETAVSLSVPLEVECGYGANWMEAH